MPHENLKTQNDGDDARRIPEKFAAEITIQVQGQFAGIGFIGHHSFMLRIQFYRMHDKGRGSHPGQLAVEVETPRPGFVNDKHPAGQRQLFLHEGQEAGRGEPLRRLGRLAVAHPDHPEMIGVPVHSQLELLDSCLRFRIWRRIRFHRHVELHVA